MATVETKKRKAAACPPVVLELVTNQASFAFRSTDFSSLNCSDITFEDFRTAPDFGKLAYRLLTNKSDFKRIKLPELYSPDAVDQLVKIGGNPSMLRLVGWVFCIFVVHSHTSKHKFIHTISEKGFSSIVATLAMVDSNFETLYELIHSKSIPFLPQPYDAAAASFLPSAAELAKPAAEPAKPAEKPPPKRNRKKASDASSAAPEPKIEPSAPNTTGSDAGPSSSSSAPSGAFGSSSAPSGAFGSSSAPSGAFGSSSAPPGAFGSSSAPPGAFGSSSAFGFGSAQAPVDSGFSFGRLDSPQIACNPFANSPSNAAPAPAGDLPSTAATPAETTKPPASRRRRQTGAK